MSLWQAATADDWTDFMYVAFYGCDAAELSVVGSHYTAHPEDCDNPSPMHNVVPVAYFVSFVIIAHLLLLNLLCAD